MAGDLLILATVVELFHNLCQARKHAAHRLVVETFGTVDDDNVTSEGFSQIFRGLGFSSASRTLWRSTFVQMKRSRQRDIAAVKIRHGNQIKCFML